MLTIFCFDLKKKFQFETFNKYYSLDLMYFKTQSKISQKYFVNKNWYY